MIYETLRFSPGGDRYIEAELGDEMSFDLNFKVHALAAAIRAARIDGLIELIPEMASLQLSYDPDRIAYGDLTREVAALHAAAGSAGDGELDSRIFYVPVLYFDPWTEACVDEYRARVTEKTPDPEMLCELNHRILGRGTRLLAGPLFADAARPARAVDRSQIQSTARLDAEGGHRARRRHHLHLS
jgi:urea carboxylase